MEVEQGDLATRVHDVRKASAAEADVLARTLARAFYEDPAIMWLLPDAARRLAASTRA